MDDRLKLEYIGHGTAPRLFINGVWGGAGGTGHVVAHMLFKHMTPPESSEVDIKTGQTVQADGAIDVSEVMCTLIIPLDEAQAIGEWLVRHATKAKEVLKVMEAGGFIPPTDTLQ